MKKSVKYGLYFVVGLVAVLLLASICLLYTSSVVTFPVHPRKVMQADYHPKLLTTCDEKVSPLAKTGVDYCMMLDLSLIHIYSYNLPLQPR